MFSGNEKVKLSHYHANHNKPAALLQDAIHSFSGGLDGALKMCDLNNNSGTFPIYLFNCCNYSSQFVHSESILGVHQDAIRCVEYSPTVNQVFSGSW